MVSKGNILYLETPVNNFARIVVVPAPSKSPTQIKFSFSEKATNICAICLVVLTFTKTIRQIAQMFCGLLRKAEL